MSIVTLKGDLVGKAVIIHGVIIKKIDIPDNFANAFPNPLPNKQTMSEDDIASIICEILPNKADDVVPLATVNEGELNEIASFREKFFYHGTKGMIEFDVVCQSGLVKIITMSYNGLTLSAGV